jgi:hypothetical protein
VSDDASRPVLTFIVRATRDRGGRLRGTVERVKTGAKAPFTSADDLGVLIEKMLGGAGGRRVKISGGPAT